MRPVASSTDRERPATARGAKNRRQWCRGKRGVEHKPECHDYAKIKNVATPHGLLGAKLYAGWKVLVCETCGKELDYWWPPLSGSRVVRSPPDWVK